MEKIDFFILIPIYKTEKFLPACLDSVLKQSYQNYRVIAVDDGSPDQAGIIADAYAEKDKRFSVIHKRNGGLLSARRAAIDYAYANFELEDSFFIFLDSDDALKENALSVIAETILKDDCDLVFYGLQRVRNGESLYAEESSPFVGTIVDKAELYKRVFFNSVYNPLCRKAIHCSLMKSEDYSAFYHISAAEDLLQSIPVYRDCRKAVFIPDLLYDYTVNETSITQSIDPNKYAIDPTVRERVLSFILEQGAFSREELASYTRFCQKMMRDEILQIVLFDLPYFKIKKLLKTMKNTPYYNNLLKDTNDFVLYSVKYGMYAICVMLVRFRCFLGKLRKK